MSYDNLSSVSQNVLKFYQQLTGEERRIPFIFDDFHVCRSRVIGLDMMENRIFTLCRMITRVVFLRMFWNFISSLPVKREGSLSFLVRTIGNVLVMEIGWKDVESGEYILLSCAHSNTSCIWNVAWKEGWPLVGVVLISFPNIWAFNNWRWRIQQESLGFCLLPQFQWKIWLLFVLFWFWVLVF